MHRRDEAGGDRDQAPVNLAAYSVAICTYNGARYVDAQLRSILDAVPGCAELILVDDASRDDTPAVAARAVEGARCRVVIERHDANIGSLRSFERALGMTTQPLVFLADQDDVWHPEKPARMLEAFARRPDLLLLHSDARIVDDDARPLGYTLLNAIEATARERAMVHDGDAFDAFVRRNIATGATIAMRRSLLDVALPIPDGWVHDEWLATIASAIGTVDFIDDPLIDYRQHANNQIGARRLSLRDKAVMSFERQGAFYENQLLRANRLLDRLVAIGSRVKPDRIEKVRAKLAHLRIRAALPRNRVARLFPILRELARGGYGRYATGMKSLVRDLLHRA